MASKKPSGLGRGLGALLGDEALKPEAAGSLYVDISQVESCSSQPRKAFDEAALAELADSIRLHGIIQPLTVRKLASGYYQIIAGERRWRAARLAGLREVPVVCLQRFAPRGFSASGFCRDCMDCPCCWAAAVRFQPAGGHKTALIRPSYLRPKNFLSERMVAHEPDSLYQPVRVPAGRRLYPGQRRRGRCTLSWRRLRPLYPCEPRAARIASPIFPAGSSSRP